MSFVWRKYMKNKLLAERARYLKENEKRVKHMCRIMEEMTKQIDQASGLSVINTKPASQGFVTRALFIF